MGGFFYVAPSKHEETTDTTAPSLFLLHGYSKILLKISTIGPNIGITLQTTAVEMETTYASSGFEALH